MEGGGDLVQDDFNQLFQHALSLAERLLNEQQGAFAPFAVAVASDGQGEQFGADPSAGPEEQIQLLEGALRQRAEQGTIRATAVCFNVRLKSREDGSETDAIEFLIEHQEGTAQRVNVPYVAEGGEYMLQDGTGSPIEPRIFG